MPAQFAAVQERPITMQNARKASFLVYMIICVMTAEQTIDR